jgi:hypothetical protein
VSASVTMNRPDVDGERADNRAHRDQIVATTLFREALERDCAEARAYAAGFVKTLGPGGQTWENIAPLIWNGWAVRHDQICVPLHDWRLSWPAAQDGWRGAGGAFDPPPPTIETPPVELIVPAVGAHVFDAFGEPAGRVKAVRDSDFHLARPLTRDVYVPFSAIIWPGRETLRIGVPNAKVGEMGWERPKLLGLFGGNPPNAELSNSVPTRDTPASARASQSGAEQT